MKFPESFNGMVGRKFGMLTVKRRSERLGPRNQTLWECACDCGGVAFTTATKLRNGHTRSCGCLRVRVCTEMGRSTATHRGTGTPEFKVWDTMKQRCTNPNDHQYPRYGGRGITICERWSDFANFLHDMGKRPTPFHTIDRINNDGNYEPLNCRWATKKQQARNRRSSRPITFGGLTMPLTDWAKQCHIDERTLFWRLRHGWTMERAISEIPVKRRK